MLDLKRGRELVNSDWFPVGPALLGEESALIQAAVETNGKM